MIRLHNIGFKTSSGIQILNNINATIASDDFIMVVGQNGAGKTTLFNILAGSLSASEGNIQVDGKPTTHLHAIVNRVHQNPLQGTIALLTVAQNIALYLYKNKSVSLRAADAILQNSPDVKIIKHYFSEDILSKKVSSLSGGQRQLLTFLMATMSPLALLLLDEPTAALDMQATDKMMHAIDQLHQQRKTALIMISHDPYIVHQYANKIWIIHNGSLVRIIDQSEKSTLTLDQIRKIMHV